jgi:hypothetical protein
MNIISGDYGEVVRLSSPGLGGEQFGVSGYTIVLPRDVLQNVLNLTNDVLFISWHSMCCIAEMVFREEALHDIDVSRLDLRWSISWQADSLGQHVAKQVDRFILWICSLAKHRSLDI